MTLPPKDIKETSGTDSDSHLYPLPADTDTPTILCSSAYVWIGNYVIDTEFSSIVGYISSEDPDRVHGLFIEADNRLVAKRYGPAHNGWLYKRHVRPLTATDLVLYDLESAYKTLSKMVSECNGSSVFRGMDKVPERPLRLKSSRTKPIP